MKRYMIPAIIFFSMMLGGCSAQAGNIREIAADSNAENSIINSASNCAAAAVSTNSSSQVLIFNPPSTTGEAFLTVPGQTSPGNRIYINEEEQPVSLDGSFTAVLHLAKGLNTFCIKEISPNARLQKSRTIEYIPNIPAPELSIGLEDLYHSGQINIEGHTNPGSKVTIDGFPIPIREDGGFMTNIYRLQGSHIINISASNQEGQTTTIQKKIRVVYPAKEPTLIVTIPEEPGFVSPDIIVINGFTDPNCLVQVFNNYLDSNNKDILSTVNLSDVGSNGIFACEVMLSPGWNKLIIRSINPAGKIKEEIRTIYCKNEFILKSYLEE